MAAELLIEQFGHEIGKQAAAEWVEFELEVAAEVSGRRGDKDSRLQHWRIEMDKDMENNDNLKEDRNDCNVDSCCYCCCIGLDG